MRRILGTNIMSVVHQVYTVTSVTHFLVDKNEVRLLGDEKGLLKYTEIMSCNFVESGLPKNLQWLYIFNKTTYSTDNSLLTDILAIRHCLNPK